MLQSTKMGLDVLTDDHNSFIASHLRQYDRLTDMTCDGYFGHFSDRNIKKHTQAFFGYMVFLYDQIKASYTDARKTPFQVLPQYSMKLRAITIGKEQLVGIVQRFVREGTLGTDIPFPFCPSEVQATDEENNEYEDIQTKKRKIDWTQTDSNKRQKKSRVHAEHTARQDANRCKIEKMEMDFKRQSEKKVKTLSKKLVAINVDRSKLHLDLQAWKEKKASQIAKEKNNSKYVCSPFYNVTSTQWKAFYPRLARHFFKPPSSVKKHWTGVVTTDGISCSWHIKKVHTEAANTAEHIDVRSLGPVSPHSRPLYYGTNDETAFNIPVGNLMAIDYGIVMLIVGDRLVVMHI